MVRFLIGWIMLAAVLVSSTPLALSCSLSVGNGTQAALTSLGEAPACPGEDARCEPCGGECLCPCCPALVTPDRFCADSELQPPTGSRQLRFSFIRIFRSSDVFFRVFHPPRLI